MGIFTLADPIQTFKLSLIYLPVVSVMLVLGILVWLTDPARKSNRWFFLTMLSFTVWMIIRFISDFNETPQAIVIDKLAVSASVIMAVSYFNFAVNFIKPTKINVKLHLLLYFFPTFTFLVATSSDWYIKELYFTDSALSKIAIRVTNLYIANTLYISFLCLLGLYLVYVKSRKRRDDRQQAKYLFIGLMLALVINVSNDFYFVSSGNDIAGLMHSVASVLGFLGFALLVSYGMLKKGLFDVRLAIIRLLGYAVSLVTISAFYGLLIYAVAGAIVPESINLKVAILGVFASVLTAMTFPFIRKYYDKISNNYFFRFSYDSSQVLQNLNKIFISNIDLQLILEKSSIEIKDALKITKITIFAYSTIKAKNQYVFSSKNLLDPNIVLHECEQAAWGTNGIIIAFRDLKSNHYFVKNKYQVLIKLSIKNTNIGYLLLGSKKSGLKYTSQDIRLLKTVKNNLSLAVNAARQYQSIQDFNKTLKNEISVATSSLKKTNNQLRKLSDYKDELISVVSHQLLPQLSATQGFLDLSRSQNITDPELLELSSSTVRRMTGLTQDLLNSSKIQFGELDLQKRAISVKDIVYEEIKHLRYAAKKHNLVINFKCHALPIFNIDETKFKEAVFNLIDNSIQYSPANSVITVVLNENKLSIVDQGIGISKEDQKLLFTKYFRSKNAKLLRPSGTGIGLFVAKNILTAHGFELNIHSVIGTGTRAEIVFGNKFSNTNV